MIGMEVTVINTRHDTKEDIALEKIKRRYYERTKQKKQGTIYNKKRERANDELI